VRAGKKVTRKREEGGGELGMEETHHSHEERENFPLIFLSPRKGGAPEPFRKWERKDHHRGRGGGKGVRIYSNTEKFDHRGPGMRRRSNQAGGGEGEKRPGPRAQGEKAQSPLSVWKEGGERKTVIPASLVKMNGAATVLRAVLREGTSKGGKKKKKEKKKTHYRRKKRGEKWETSSGKGSLFFFSVEGGRAKKNRRVALATEKEEEGGI